MRTDELHHGRQAAENNNSLRLRLLREISDICPPPRAPQVHAAAESEEVEWSNCHPFRDLNLTNLARRMDALFNRRWLAGCGSSKKATPSTWNPVSGWPNAKHY